MVEGKFKSRSKKRVKTVVPGGKAVIHYRRKTPQKAKCAQCLAELHGIPAKINSTFKNLTKSQKTVARPFGGNLCSKCSRLTIKSKIKE